MIFRMKNRQFESEKERNLYYKFFAGFYFNELILGYDTRLQEFYALLSNPPFQVGDSQMDQLQEPPGEVFVSFDNHPDRYLEKQSGEFADILIHDPGNNFLIAIEAKYLDDWDYQKDIVQNSEKLELVGGKLGVDKTLLCLLIAQSKWENVVAMEAHPGSNFLRLKEHPGSVSVLFWESLSELPGVSSEVRSYLEAQLDDPRLNSSK